MNILVMGGTCFMGKHLVHELLSSGHCVTIATRGITKDYFGDQVNRICFDRFKEQSIKAAFSGLHFDVVYDSLAFCSNDIKNLLEHIKCDRYIETSSGSVYDKLHMDTKETEFNASEKELVFGGTNDFDYNTGKQQAECAIVQMYSHISSVRVRFPFVIGEDDYTNRLYFYVEHMLRQIPIYIDNYESPMAFVHSKEAGKFLACLADHDFCGAANAASSGTITLKRITEYIQLKTGKGIIIRDNAEAAPYNDTDAYSMNIDTAKQIGFLFTPLDTWIYRLLDQYIVRCQSDTKGE